MKFRFLILTLCILFSSYSFTNNAMKEASSEITLPADAPELLKAIQENNIEKVKLLLKDKKTDVNQTYDSYSALMLAAPMGNKEIVKLYK